MSAQITTGDAIPPWSSNELRQLRLALDEVLAPSTLVEWDREVMRRAEQLATESPPPNIISAKWYGFRNDKT